MDRLGVRRLKRVHYLDSSPHKSAREAFVPAANSTVCNRAFLKQSMFLHGHICTSPPSSLSFPLFLFLFLLFCSFPFLLPPRFLLRAPQAWLSSFGDPGLVSHGKTVKKHSFQQWCEQLRKRRNEEFALKTLIVRIYSLSGLSCCWSGQFLICSSGQPFPLIKLQPASWL